MSRPGIVVAAAVLSVLASALPIPAHSNLIVNGSFEAPGSAYGPFGIEAGSAYFPGWVVSRGDVDYGGPGSCGDGLHCLDLDGYTFGGIAQTFQTEPGVRYHVAFLLSGNPSSASDPVEKYLGLSAAGSSSGAFVFTVVPGEWPLLRWVPEEWFFVATASSTTIEFYSLDSSELGHSGLYGPMLDAVVVEAVQEPSTAGLFALVLVAFASAAKRCPTPL